MRIIAGDHRGRELLGPADAQTTRPITDRVKESLFNRLTSLGLLQPDEGSEHWHAVDVFCGTGSIGLECLSRGAASCTFVDMDRDAIDRLEQNLEATRLTERSRIVRGSALTGVWAASIRPGSVQVASFDPPYAMMIEEASRQQVLDLAQRIAPIIEPGGVAMIRTPLEVELPELSVYDGPGIADYGKMRLHFYQVPLSEVEDESGG